VHLLLRREQSPLAEVKDYFRSQPVACKYLLYKTGGKVVAGCNERAIPGYVYNEKINCGQIKEYRKSEPAAKLMNARLQPL